MPEYKNTVFINGNTNNDGSEYGRRAYGFSESFYSTAQYTGWDDPLERLMKARANMLPNGSAVVGFRIAALDPKGASISHNRVFESTWDENSDYPTLALYAKGQVGLNTLKLVLRGLPDVATDQGEWNKGSDLSKRWNQFKVTLPGFHQKCIKLDAPQADIIGIDANGVVRTAQDFSIAVGNPVRIMRVQSAWKGNFNGLYYVSTVTSARQFTVHAWEGGETSGGRVRKHEIINVAYPADMVSQRIISRKVGRSFFSLAG